MEKRYKVKSSGSKIRIDRAFFENRTIDLRPEAVQLRTELVIGKLIQ
jgi:IS30 family transposase